VLRPVDGRSPDAPLRLTREVRAQVADPIEIVGRGERYPSEVVLRFWKVL